MYIDKCASIELEKNECVIFFYLAESVHIGLMYVIDTTHNRNHMYVLHASVYVHCSVCPCYDLQCITALCGSSVNKSFVYEVHSPS